jgi:hypothetical protein
MGALLFAVGAPTLVFGLFALLAVRFGAESRPYFDEKPVYDDRPNWFPIARSVPASGDDDRPDDGEPLPAPEPAPRRAPAPRRRQPVVGAPASASSAAMSPSGVWSAASTSGS